jgi:type II secretory pathway pseudopilin PulG
MRKPNQKNLFAQRPHGFALLVTMIVLVVLASLLAGLATRLTMAKRRQNYMIEYQRARYGLDSGIKYILTEVPTVNLTIRARENKPDFSDLFYLNQQQYAEMIAAWAATATDEQIEALLKEDASVRQSEPLSPAALLSQLTSLFGGGGDAGELPPIAVPEGEQAYVFEIDPNDIQVPGPYGAAWPYVLEPIEMDIGPCHVTITIEDENAKLPLSWLITTYQEDDKRAQYAIEEFGEWMRMTPDQIKELRSQCEQIYKMKPYRMNAGPILVPAATTTAARRSAASQFRTSQTAPARQTPAPAQTATQQRPAIAHTTDFAKLFHSSLLNREKLAYPVPDTGERVETSLKYLGLWGSQRVNINTAPRHVLHAAFMMALTWDDAVNLADEVIRQRQLKPIGNVNTLKEMGSLDTETFNRLNNYITSTSRFLKITVSSTTGNARANAILTVVNENKQSETLMVLYDESL